MDSLISKRSRMFPTGWACDLKTELNAPWRLRSPFETFLRNLMPIWVAICFSGNVFMYLLGRFGCDGGRFCCFMYLLTPFVRLVVGG